MELLGDPMPSDASREHAPNKTDFVRVTLDTLARRYYAPLASFFRKRTRDAPEVQDLVQQVFLRLAQSRETGEIQNPDAYIFQTAANTLRDHYRHLAVRNRYLNEKRASADPHVEVSSERVVLGRENLACVADALKRLPERTRDILTLRCFEGLKISEIARLQNVSVRCVEKHIAKALASLSLSLDRDAGE